MMKDPGIHRAPVSLLRLITGLAAIVAALLLLQTLTVSAQQPEPRITIGFQEEATAGETIAVSAYLIDPAGNPIYDAEVSFALDVEFLNVTDDVELGHAVTDETGLALIEYEPRIEGTNSITAIFDGNEVFAPATATSQLEVESGGQLYREFRPYRIPGANVWMTTAVIATVWIIFIICLGLIGWANYRVRTERGGSGV